MEFRVVNCIWYENNCDLERNSFRYSARVQVWARYSNIAGVGHKCVDTFWNTFDGVCLRRKCFRLKIILEYAVEKRFQIEFQKCNKRQR